MNISSGLCRRWPCLICLICVNTRAYRFHEIVWPRSQINRSPRWICAKSNVWYSCAVSKLNVMQCIGPIHIHIRTGHRCFFTVLILLQIFTRDLIWHWLVLWENNTSDWAASGTFRSAELQNWLCDLACYINFLQYRQNTLLRHLMTPFLPKSFVYFMSKQQAHDLWMGYTLFGCYGYTECWTWT